MKIKFFDCNHLGHHTIWIALDRPLLVYQIIVIILNLRFPDRLIANNSCDLFGHIVLSVDGHCCKKQGGKCNNVSEFHCVRICEKQCGKFSEKC